MAKLQLFLAQMKDKQVPPNAPPKVFKQVHTFLVKLQIKLGLGNKEIPKPSIGQKSSLCFHPLIAVKNRVKIQILSSYTKRMLKS